MHKEDLTDVISEKSKNRANPEFKFLDVKNAGKL